MSWSVIGPAVVLLRSPGRVSEQMMAKRSRGRMQTAHR